MTWDPYALSKRPPECNWWWWAQEFNPSPRELANETIRKVMQSEGEAPKQDQTQSEDPLTSPSEVQQQPQSSTQTATSDQDPDEIPAYQLPSGLRL